MTYSSYFFFRIQVLGQGGGKFPGRKYITPQRFFYSDHVISQSMRFTATRKAHMWLQKLGRTMRAIKLICIVFVACLSRWGHCLLQLTASMIAYRSESPLQCAEQPWDAKDNKLRYIDTARSSLRMKCPLQCVAVSSMILAWTGHPALAISPKCISCEISWSLSYCWRFLSLRSSVSSLQVIQNLGLHQNMQKIKNK